MNQTNQLLGEITTLQTLILSKKVFENQTKRLQDLYLTNESKIYNPMKHYKWHN